MSAVATTRAVRLHAAGGTEGFRVEELPVPAPGPGEILIRQTVAGLNFLDIYHRHLRGEVLAEMPPNDED